MQAITIVENEYMVAWDRVTRSDVLRAIKEYDRLGPKRFFSEHGFAPTTTYELAWEQRRYPPKAILGTAYDFATGQRLVPATSRAERLNEQGRVHVLGYFRSLPKERPVR